MRHGDVRPNPHRTVLLVDRVFDLVGNAAYEDLFVRVRQAGISNRLEPVATPLPAPCLLLVDASQKLDQRLRRGGSWRTGGASSRPLSTWPHPLGGDGHRLTGDDHRHDA